MLCSSSRENIFRVQVGWRSIVDAAPYIHLDRKFAYLEQQSIMQLQKFNILKVNIHSFSVASYCVY